jgi:hypothetical protein
MLLVSAIFNIFSIGNSENTYYKKGGYNKEYQKHSEQPVETERPKKKMSSKDQASEMAQGKGKVKTSNRFELLE